MIAAWSRITSIYIFVSIWFSFGVKCRSALNAQVIKNTQCDGICRLTAYYQGHFCSSAPRKKIPNLGAWRKYFYFPWRLRCWFYGRVTVYHWVTRHQLLVLGVFFLLVTEFKISGLVADPPKPVKQECITIETGQRALNTQTTLLTECWLGRV